LKIIAATMVSRKEAMEMPYILQTNHLTKTIGGKELVSNVNLHIKKGEIYGFLGPNGAGKTTVMKIITNLWKPTDGKVEIFGETLTPQSYEVLKRMGSIIEFPTFYDHMTGYENLKLHSEYMGYYNHGSIENALDMLDLTKAAGKPVKNYSLGMKERLGIARAILCKPELLILDEPTNGLDPVGMKQIRDLLKTLCTEYGITIMISSHILSEIESIANTVGVINHGMMMKEIGMKEIEQMNLAYIELSVMNTKKAAYVLSEKLGLINFKIIEDGQIRIYDNHVSTQELSKVLALNDVEVIAIGKKAETLEDYFLKMTAEVKNYVEAD
jgi:ABC-2 type transport system ATP-binding protein